MHREFRVVDHVYLRVKPKKSSMNLRSCSKLAPRYCIPFEVLDILGPISYRIASPVHMKSHNFYHVSLLKNYVHDPNHVINSNVIQVELEGEFQVESMCILEKKVTLLQNQAIR